jgi:hypothetical protein
MISYFNESNLPLGGNFQVIYSTLLSVILFLWIIELRQETFLNIEEELENNIINKNSLILKISPILPMLPIVFFVFFLIIIQPAANHYIPDFQTVVNTFKK